MTASRSPSLPSFSPPTTRREFLANVGRAVLTASVGFETATGLGLSPLSADEHHDALSFGPMEPLVRLLQETPINQIMPVLIERLNAGADLRQLVSAGALANARTFGGEDYVGFHTMMALAPAFHMAHKSPPATRALPVLKVLYRNTHRIQEHGGRTGEVLHAAPTAPLPQGRAPGELLQEAMRQKNVDAAEGMFATLALEGPEQALNHLLYAVQDHTEVHRVVLPYRAWDMLGIMGKEQAHTLLRQSLRYCVKAESWPHQAADDEPRILLPKLLQEHRLLQRGPGTQPLPDDALEALSQTIFKSTPPQAAGAVAAALAEGIDPAAVGEALTLAANQLVLRDQGRRPAEEVPGKPIGSVHGDSIGVHATDSANAWRNLARVANTRNRFASLILGAYQVAQDRTARGGDFLNWQPMPFVRHADEAARVSDGAALLRQAEEAIRGNLQAAACAAIERYGKLGLDSEPVMDLMLRYAVSEDGSLHAEKFYQTACEEFASTRPAFRWRHLVALARVTASEFGRPAPGLAEARALLRL